MDRQQFDDLARALAESSATRRNALRVLVGGALAPVGVTCMADATAQARGNEKVKNQGDRGGQKKGRCGSPGKICFRKPKKATSRENKDCKLCCGGTFRQLNVTKGRCCNHNGLPCSTTDQCCLGVCTNGTCQNDIIQLPPPPPGDAACVGFGGACTQSADCCSGVPCTGNNEGQNFTCRYP